MSDNTGKADRRRIFHWVFLSVIWLISFAFAEIALRIMVPPPVWKGQEVGVRNFTARPSDGLGSFDPALGWVMRPGSKGHDSHGFRKNENQVNYESPARILAVGDSYTYGTELPGKQSFPAYLELKLKMRVHNGGVAGYGLAQMLVQIEKHIDRVDPATVVVAPISDDLLRTGLRIRHGVNQPYYKLDHRGELTLVEATDYRLDDRRSLFQKIGGYSYIVHLLMTATGGDFWIRGTNYEFKKADIDLLKTSKKIIDKMKSEVVDRRGKNLVFVFLPESPREFRMTEPDRDYIEIYKIADYMAEVAHKDERVAFIDLQDILHFVYPDVAERQKLYFEVSTTSGGHFNAKGTQFVADQISRYLDREGRLVPKVQVYDFALD